MGMDGMEFTKRRTKVVMVLSYYKTTVYAAELK
jgi:hypothetical protein